MNQYNDACEVPDNYDPSSHILRGGLCLPLAVGHNVGWDDDDEEQIT